MQICDVFPAIEGAHVHIGSKWGIWLSDLEASELQTHPQKHGTCINKVSTPHVASKNCFSLNLSDCSPNLESMPKPLIREKH